MSFSPFAILTAEEMNDLVENIEHIYNGGLADGSVTAAKLNLPWTDWTPTLVGFSANPSGAVYRYHKVGTHVSLSVSMPNNGTSNGTSFTISLPFTAATIAGVKWVVPVVQPVNNGSVNTSNPGIATIDSGGTVITLLRDLGGSTWTNSGGKRVPWFSMEYESAS